MRDVCIVTTEHWTGVGTERGFYNHGDFVTWKQVLCRVPFDVAFRDDLLHRDDHYVTPTAHV
ncbi:hypothetical protein D3C72_2431320 [compost metagenome]